MEFVPLNEVPFLIFFDNDFSSCSMVPTRKKSEVMKSKYLHIVPKDNTHVSIIITIVIKGNHYIEYRDSFIEFIFHKENLLNSLFPPSFLQAIKLDNLNSLACPCCTGTELHKSLFLCDPKHHALCELARDVCPNPWTSLISADRRFALFYCFMVQSVVDSTVSL